LRVENRNESSEDFVGSIFCANRKALTPLGVRALCNVVNEVGRQTQASETAQPQLG
jgi:hypothetical protein